MTANERQLFLFAAFSGHFPGVVSQLKLHPELDVNWADDDQRTALHYACWNGHAELVKFLLGHPNIYVNVKTTNGSTPISLGCRFGGLSVVRVLLKDPRVELQHCDSHGRSTLWWISREGNHEVIEYLLASGKELEDFERLRGMHVDDGKDYTALEIAREKNNTGTASLLERFAINPALTRHELRVKLGMVAELAAEVFALTVFLCDGLLQLKPPPLAAASTPTDAVVGDVLRFFTIAAKLPLELQMILCYRTVGSKKQSILHRESEVAFKSLAKILLSSKQA